MTSRSTLPFWRNLLILSSTPASGTTAFLHISPQGLSFFSFRIPLLEYNLIVIILIRLMLIIGTGSFPGKAVGVRIGGKGAPVDAAPAKPVRINSHSYLMYH